MALKETSRSTVMTRKIYIRPEHESAWQRAVKIAKRDGVSLSEVVSIAVTKHVDTTDTNA